MVAFQLPFQAVNNIQFCKLLTMCDKAGLDLSLDLGSRLGSRLGLGLGLVLGS